MVSVYLGWSQTRDANGVPVTVRGIQRSCCSTAQENFQDGHKSTFNTYATYETSINKKHNIKLMLVLKARAH